MALAIRTHIPPDVWEAQTPEAITTAVELLHAADEEERRAARRG